jgi:hypothetical protein
MSERDDDGPSVERAPAAKNGWWWRLVALFAGVPPVAVYGAEDEVDAERSAGAPRPSNVTE